MDRDRPDGSDKAADLADAARAAVRDPGDPRIDAHLASLGLLPEDAAPDPRPPAAAPAIEVRAESRDHPELPPLLAKIDQLEAALAAARGRIRWLAVALVGALAALGIAIAALVAGRA